MSETKPLKLAIDNAAEDVPRLIMAYGRCHDGEAALVLRPHDKLAFLVHVPKKAEQALVWRSTGEADGPRRPSTSMDLKAAVAELKVAKKVSGAPGPITFKGTWSGTLECDADGKPLVRLSRKISAYATVHLEGSPAGWSWVVKRLPRWFGDATEVKGKATPLLIDAIQAAYQGALGSVAQACSVRDTTRRAAKDPAFAAQHPVTPAASPKTDATKRLEAKADKAGKPKADKATPAKAPKADKAPKAAATPAPPPAKPAAAPAKAAPAKAAPASKGKGKGKDERILGLFKQAVNEALA